MDEATRIKNAKAFAKEWSGSHYDEHGNTSKFWIELLEQVFGVKNASKLIQPEMSVPNMNRHQDYIDIYIPSTRVVIEQKRPSIDLDRKESRPSFTAFDGWVTPFEQAQTYNKNLPYSKHGRWVITCNFHEFRIYDTNENTYYPKPTVITLNNLWRDYYQLDILIKPHHQDVTKEKKLSTKACKLITKIYHQLLDQYDNPKDPKVLQQVNKVCVRLVFCFYADDSGIFGHHSMFHNYMKNVPADLWRIVMSQLFKVLDQKIPERDNQLNNKLASFPYVNGGLFKHLGKLPKFTKETKKLVLDAGYNFDWSQISPTIFGSMFETTLNPKERHINGMHYTSPRNIHRVIDKLFLNDLTNELNAIKTKYGNTAEASSKAKKFQDKLASLTFLDPACGSGNFLTETYLCLRKLENQAIKLRLNNNGQFNIELLGGNKLIEVHITQFHGIEINDFAVSVAKTAMWIAESQMIKETQYIVGEQINSLPLTSNPNIIEANALETDWSKAVNPDDLNYIISNPPFAGDRKDKQQKQDMKDVMKGFKSIGKLDLVSAWYKKSADMLLKNKNIHIALVSTNNITNGIQVYPLWSRLINKYHVHINFAYRMFKWQNSAKHQAVVYCVIIGFSLKDEPQKEIVGSNGRTYHAKHISPYLYELPNILVSSANKPLSPNIPKMRSGSKPTDKGKLSRYSDKKKNEICSKYPSAQKLFKRFVGASEFLKNKTRWCLWLKGVDTKDWINIPPIYKAVQEVKQYRKGSHDKATQRSASVPYLFQAIRQPDTDYLLVPSHTSMHRRYVPVGYFNKNVIVNNSSLYIPNATRYMFGILESRLHTLWVSLVSGRFGPSFRYSAKITYNNFPWISVTMEQKQTISKTAQGILNTRANHHGDSLSDLYDTSAMPIDLQKAHQANDKAVRRVYGITKNMSKDQIFTKLLKMYSKLKQNR